MYISLYHVYILACMPVYVINISLYYLHQFILSISVFIIYISCYFVYPYISCIVYIPVYIEMISFFKICFIENHFFMQNTLIIIFPPLTLPNSSPPPILMHALFVSL